MTAQAPDSGAIRRLTPRTQASFLGFFSLAYTVGYSIPAGYLDHQSLPPKAYFLVLAIVYAFLWIPFYFPRIFAVPRAAFRYLARVLTKLGQTLSITSLERLPEEQSPWSDTEVAGTLFKPTQVTKSKAFKWPLPEALQVQLLAVAIISMAGWYTIYCGGPFQSPFGQILLALPLLSPNIASKANSILAVYIVTAINAALFAAIATERSNPPPQIWYASTALGILAISAYVSWVVRFNTEKGKNASKPPSA